MALKLLRNFGHLITNLHLDYKLFYLNIHTWNGPPIVHPLCKEIEHYLEEYCSESLRQISFQSNVNINHHEVLKDVQKSFKNVKIVHTQLCRFGDVLPFNKVFPNLNTLKLGSNQYENRSAIRVHFPSVENLWFFDKIFLIGGAKFKEEDIEEMLKLNSQFKSSLLYLKDVYNSNFIARLKEYCPNIQLLQNEPRNEPDPYNRSIFSFEAFLRNTDLKRDARDAKTFTDITESHQIKISNKYKNALQDLFELNMHNYFSRGIFKHKNMFGY